MVRRGSILARLMLRSARSPTMYQSILNERTQKKPNSNFFAQDSYVLGPDNHFGLALAELLDGRELPSLGHWFGQLLDGDLGEIELVALLIALRAKGETAADLAAAARELRSRMIRFDAGTNDVLDTCGTGGDGTGTFNISTCVAFVVAAAGVRVVKHGNRAVSSTTGSSDVLAALGLPVNAGSAWARSCLDAAGLAFCYAPDYHPRLAALAELRRRLGVRTVFNCLGPLTNPARPAYQLLGVGRPELLDPMADALAELGSKRAIVVCGRGGFDEVSLNGPTDVRQVETGTVTRFEWTPADFGVGPVDPAEIRVCDAAASAAMIETVLAGRTGPAQRVVVANAAVALVAAGRATSLVDGVALAAEAVASGRAKGVLERMRACGPALR